MIAITVYRYDILLHKTEIYQLEIHDLVFYIIHINSTYFILYITQKFEVIQPYTHTHIHTL